MAKKRIENHGSWNGFVATLGCICALASLANTAHAAPPAAAAPASPANPFAEGTVAVKLSAQQIADLSAYINQSQTTLETAINDAKGLSLSEASQVYLEAVKSVVLLSNESHPRTETLMRVILNQALALTYGTPKASGSGIEVAGVLIDTHYQDILRDILRDSIELALQYADQDKVAAQKGSFADLPYAEVAQKRMIMAQGWMNSVFEQDLTGRFGVESMQQWLNVMMIEDQQHQAKFASEISQISEALIHAAAIAQKKGLSREVIAGEQERLSRITMRKVIGKIAAKLDPSGSATSQAAVVPGVDPSSEGGPAQPGPLDMRFVAISPGTFTMGSPASESGRDADETQHQVTLTKGFEMQATDVTQAQWMEVMGSNPSSFNSKENCPQSYREVKGTGLCPNHPVEQVSWNDTRDFIAQMNARDDGYKYRLPTEAEWEYSARAGTTTAYSFGSDESWMGQYSWYSVNSGGQTHDVATLKANPWGLYDMHGNVYQWVQDIYGPYAGGQINPPGASSGPLRSIRGGSWYYDAQFARSALRYWDVAGYRYFVLGFRLVRTRR